MCVTCCVSSACFSGVGPRWPPGCQLGMCKRRQERLRADRPRSELLASFDNYHLPRKNDRFHLLIWHGHLWGGRFQMAVIGERQVTGEVTGGNGGNPSGQKGLLISGYGGFWLCDKCRIGAVIKILPIPFSFSTVIGDVFYPDPKSIKVLGSCEQGSPRAILKKRR